ncbi:MAG: hypothetical protein WCL13_02640 [bacterium]
MKVLKSLLCLSLVLFFTIFFLTAARAEEIAPNLILSAPLGEAELMVNLLPPPTLISPDETTITAKIRPLIIGLTESGSLVKIFIDDIYNGKTEILNNDSGTANFAYRPFLNLSRGWHKVYVIAEDSAGRVSRPSEVLSFNIELPMPAPTMLKPVVNKNTFDAEPFIVGLAKNDSKIKIYIDKKYNGEFKVTNHPSGTANFAYKPTQPLTRGNHLVYAVAVDKRGKQSEWSNIVYFSTKNSAIAESAQEKSDAIADFEDPEEAVKINYSTSGTSEKPEQTSLGEIKSLSGDNTGVKAKPDQKKLSLVFFILFLVSVIAWLLWVNRKLAKELQARNEDEDKIKKDKLL